jgi:hypothetical protein
MQCNREGGETGGNRVVAAVEGRAVLEGKRCAARGERLPVALESPLILLLFWERRWKSFHPDFSTGRFFMSVGRWKDE